MLSEALAIVSAVASRIFVILPTFYFEFTKAILPIKKDIDWVNFKYYNLICLPGKIQERKAFIENCSPGYKLCKHKEKSYAKQAGACACAL